MQLRNLWIGLILFTALFQPLRAQYFNNSSRIESARSFSSYNQSIRLANGNILTTVISYLDDVNYIIGSTTTQLHGALTVEEFGTIAMIRDANQNLVRFHKWIPEPNAGPNNDYFYIFQLLQASDGSIYLAGQHAGMVDFDPGSSSSIAGQTANATEAFVIKLNAIGDYLWHKRFKSPQSDEGFVRIAGISEEQTGNIVAMGSFKGDIDFDPGSGTAMLYNSDTESDGFIFKIDTAGSFVSVNELSNADIFKTTPNSLGGKIATGYLGDSALNANANGGAPILLTPDPVAFECYVLNYDINNNLLWSKLLKEYIVIETKTDAAGNVYIGSQVHTGATLGNGMVLTPNGSYDLAVEKFSPSGTNIWSVLISGAGTESTRSLQVANGAVYFTYTYMDSLETHSGSQDTMLFDPDQTRNVGLSIFDQSSGAHLGSYALDADSVIFGGYNLLVENNRVDFTMNTYGQTDLDPGLQVMNSPVQSSALRYMSFVSWNLAPLVFPTALSDAELNENISIYPNPAQAWLNVDLKKNARAANVILFDLAGHQLLSQDLSLGNNQLDISTFSPGVYIIKVQMDAQVVTRKVIRL